MEAVEQWPAHAGAQDQLLSALYNITCSDSSRLDLSLASRLVVRAGRAALAAIRAHPTSPAVHTAALLVLRSPVSTVLHVEAAGTLWLVEEGGLDVLAEVIHAATRRSDWVLVISAVNLLDLWVRNPACAVRLGNNLYGALVGACRACQRPETPDGLRVALAGVLGAYSRHPANGLRAQEALAEMDPPDSDEEMPSGGAVQAAPAA